MFCYCFLCDLSCLSYSSLVVICVIVACIISCVLSFLLLVLLRVAYILFYFGGSGPCCVLFPPFGLISPLRLSALP